MAISRGVAMVGLLLAAMLAMAMSYQSSRRQVSMEPELVFESEGGTCEHWMSERHEMMRHMKVEAARLTLRDRGLFLPSYSDSSLLIYCVRGRAMTGLSLPMGMHRSFRMIEKGQMMAVPRGMIFWLYNMGMTVECELMIFADTSMGASPGESTGFSLIGGRKGRMGGILRGFSKDMLADAWDVSEDMVERMVEGQEGAGIVRVSENHPFHMRMREEASRRSMRAHMRRESNEEQQVEANTHSAAMTSMMHFMYDMERATCDHYSNRGGCMTVLNRYRLPVLKSMRPQSGMGAARIRLEPDAMVAPGYIGNAHQMVYCMRGSARMQVVQPSGERFFDDEIREGQMVIIPMGYPEMKRAGGDGCELIVFFTSDMPMGMFMAGRETVFANMPEELMMAAFNVDEEVVSTMLERRTRHAVILPPARGRDELQEDSEEDNVVADHLGVSPLHMDIDTFLSSLKN